MIRIGHVARITKTGLAVVEVEASRPPRIGAKIYDSSKTPVGVVADVIGPVSRPFAVVKPVQPGAIEEGMVLYILPPRRPGKRGRGKPRRGRRR